MCAGTYCVSVNTVTACYHVRRQLFVRESYTDTIPPDGDETATQTADALSRLPRAESFEQDV